MPSEKMSREYRRGARDEAAAIVAGMSKDGREVYDYVLACAQQGDAGPDIVREVAHVFTASRRERLALAWQLATR